MKKKMYIETEESLDWMRKNLPNHKESEFIRKWVAKGIQDFIHRQTLRDQKRSI